MLIWQSLQCSHGSGGRPDPTAPSSLSDHPIFGPVSFLVYSCTFGVYIYIYVYYLFIYLFNYLFIYLFMYLLDLFIYLFN